MACAPGVRPDACRPKNTIKQTTRTEFLNYLEGHWLLQGGLITRLSCPRVPAGRAGASKISGKSIA